MSIRRKLQKKASRLSLFNPDRLSTVCDGDISISISSPITLTRTKTPTPDFEAALDSSSPPATFEKLQPVEYIAPKPRRSRSINFDTLRRRVSVLASPSTTSNNNMPLPAQFCPGSPRLGPNGVLVSNGLFDKRGNPVTDAPTPRTFVPRSDRGGRPMSSFFAPSLPPGAAQPVLGSMLFDQNQAVETLDDDVLFVPPSRLHQAYGRSTRSNSMSAADALSISLQSETPSNHPRTPLERGDQPRPRQQPSRPTSPFERFSAVLSTASDHFLRGSMVMSSSSSRAAPAVPPRSRLRGAPASTPSTNPSSAASSSAGHASPSASGRSSPAPQSRPYVLEVALPIADVAKDLPLSPRQSDEVITFGRSHRRTNNSGNHSQNKLDRDPHKIRDGLASHSARSGVYTPKTFPGVMGATSPTSPNTNYARASSSARSPASVRSRTVSGFKRFSTAFAHGPSPGGHPEAHHTLTISPPIPMPPVRHMPSHHIPVGQHSRQVSVAGSHAGSHGSHAMSRGSSSPSSDHSATSISPPGTPTTPTSGNHACGLNLHSVPTSRPVVIVPADVAPEFERPEVHLEPAFKMSPYEARSNLPPISTSSPVTGTPYADKSTPLPLSPTAPKRARRKPVPRLDEDLEALEA